MSGFSPVWDFSHSDGRGDVPPRSIAPYCDGGILPERSPGRRRSAFCVIIVAGTSLQIVARQTRKST
jgi:hypothetical protein